MEKYINEIIDIIENNPELNKQKIIEKFQKNTDRKFTTPELQSIYKKSKRKVYEWTRKDIRRNWKIYK